MFRADYNFEIIADIICIIDENAGGKSVTNDIENVLDDIQKSGINIEEHKIIYRDSEGFWDGITLHKVDPIEISFFNIGEKNIDNAIFRVQELSNRQS